MCLSYQTWLDLVGLLNRAAGRRTREESAEVHQQYQPEADSVGHPAAVTGQTEEKGLYTIMDKLKYMWYLTTINYTILYYTMQCYTIL